MADDDAGMRVHVKVGGMKFTIPIGDGDQDFKWLGMVASQRQVFL